MQLRWIPFLLPLCLAANTQASLPLGLDESVALAVANAPGISARIDEAEALQNRSTSSGQLPDPELQFGALNLPTDTFDVDQDPMTQLKVGVGQRFPAGHSRQREQAIYASQAGAALSSADERRLLVQREVQVSWLEIYYGREAATILRSNRQVLEQLRMFIRSLYQTGRGSQQDITRIDVELSRLAEREIMLGRETQAWRARLGRWLGDQAWRPVGGELPPWQTPVELDREGLAASLVQHPAVIAMDHQVEASREQVELSREHYRPEWGVNVSYGHRRSEDLAGDPRPDLLSAMVSVSMPLFRKSRQDKQVAASMEQSSATLNRRSELLLRLRGEMWAELSRARQYDRQIRLYEDAILKQLRLQAESALQAYQADATDFSEVMRATLATLDGELDYQRLQIDRLIALSQLRYYLEPEAVAGGVHR